jgi:hypothetical protein
MKLSRIIPSRTKIVRFKGVVRDWMRYSTFRDSRRASGMANPYTKCYWCKSEFMDDYTINLAFPEKGKNRVLCDICADELEAS